MTTHCNEIIQCPVTKNAVVKMSRKGFERACVTMREARRKSGDKDYVYPHCRSCMGKALPPGLALFELHHLMETNMGKIPSKGTCECCGRQETPLLKQYGDRVCSTCQAMRIVVKNNPQAVVEQLERFGGVILTGGVRSPAQSVSGKTDEAGPSQQQQLDDYATLYASAKTYIGELEQEKADIAAASNELAAENGKLLARIGELEREAAEESGSAVKQDPELQETLDAVSAERDDLVKKLREVESRGVLSINVHGSDLERLALRMAMAMLLGKHFTYHAADIELLYTLAGVDQATPVMAGSSYGLFDRRQQMVAAANG